MVNLDIIADVNRRHEIVYIFDVADGNPNGDPDAENLPRFDPETMQGITTDVMLKRKIRDYVNVMFDKPIFIQSQAALNSLIREAFLEEGYEPCEIELSEEELEEETLIEWLLSKENLGYSIEEGKLVYSGDRSRKSDLFKELCDGLEQEQEAMKTKLDNIAKRVAEALKNKSKKKISDEMRDKARNRLCEKYYDIRMFGAVLSTGLNAGQVRGPVQFTFARSIDPIYPVDVSITRKARTTLARKAREGETEMARKPIVPYGLYRAHGFFNPFLAKTTGVTSGDLQLLYEALQNMFELDRSAARGNMAVKGIAVFSHENEKGNASADRLFRLVRISRKEGVSVPRSIEDYYIAAPEGGSLEAYSFSGVELTWIVKPDNFRMLDPDSMR
ncbi:MAG: type I-C CRISPR-associated protein Cas7/Csd2 [Actinobacteria bacterium]|nr:type I-C CRISPR-associated protein Cas7/Csd2 [Actinomycetota bacterium]